MHPEDSSRVRQAYEAARIERHDFAVDYRILLPNGTTKYMHTVGHPVMNEAGAVVEFAGTGIEVTEHVEARLRLEKALEQIRQLKDRLQEENLALREEVVQASMFEEIIGTSPALQATLTGLTMVAPTDSSVLITGETGTGKELIARAIHGRSRRADNAFVTVNCAAIPAGLIASELFGHEKGAFTGALQQRRGRFELAQKGTIFLDEIGDVPAETQVALLRVLQERNFERVGGSNAISLNVRIIAATNRDLSAAVSSKTFRSDLFYRLNVFPIAVPPLRERREDIPLLVEYFVKRFAEKMGKRIRTIDKRTLEACLEYPWPGNIRELQNIVERSMILCTGETFAIDVLWLSGTGPAHADGRTALPHTIRSRERELIEAALARSHGKVAGAGGAAARLGIPASTLESKIRQLEIDKRRFMAHSSA
jgi:transcriptional regulator with GAF, ATPase, and Fis domain